MRKRSYIIISILLAFTFFFTEVKADPRDQSVSQYRRRNYYMKVFSGEWNYSAAIGLNQYSAENNSESTFFKRLGYTGSLSIHRDISESFTGRWKMNINSLAKYTYTDNKYRHFITMSSSLDLMYNLKHLLQPYDIDNTMKYWVFFGGGIYHSFAERNIPQMDYAHPGVPFDIPTIIPMVNAGAVVQIPLTFNLDLNVELKGVIVTEKFDNEKGGGGTYREGYEGYGAVLFGITYHL